MGPGKAFDPTKYFIFCGNVMGSPYGSASPVTVNPDTGKPYGPEFPLTSIRDDVRYGPMTHRLHQHNAHVYFFFLSLTGYTNLLWTTSVFHP